MSVRDFFASMESEDNADENLPEETGSDSLEADLTEVEEAGAEADTDQTNVEQLEDTAEALESIALSLEADAKNGGLDPVAARYAQRAIDFALRPLGPSAKFSHASLESFGGDSSKQSATLSMEADVKAWLKKVWEAIKRAIAKVRDSIKQLFIKLFAAAPKLKRRADALQTTAKGLEGEPKEKQLTISGNIASGIAIGKKVDALGETAHALRQRGDWLFDDFFKKTWEYGEAFANALANWKFDSEKNFDASAKSIANVFEILPTVTGAKAAAGDKRFQGLEVDRSEAMPGNQAIFVTCKKQGTTLAAQIDSLASYSVSVRDFTATPVEVKEVKISVPNKGEIEKVGSEISALAARVSKFNNAFQTVDQLINKVKGAGDKFSTEAEKSEKLTGENKSAARQILSAAKSCANVVDAPAVAITRYLITTGAKVLALAEKAAGQYKG
ncbi:hypothetical protein Xoosp14_10 [Xanthomonas phage Xoo-sp14]|nr:hypothetical protein Xoosp14_10 [Xanthomonas phage Xoo-sp14]